MKCSGSFILLFLSLTTDSRPLGRVLIALALTLKSPGKNAKAHAHTCTSASPHGGKYQLNHLPLPVSLSLPTLFLISIKKKIMCPLGHDSQVSKMCGLCECVCVRGHGAQCAMETEGGANVGFASSALTL